MINVKDLRVADVKYYDDEHNGIEFTAPLSRVVLLKRDDMYINLLNPGEIAPIYRRIPNTANVYNHEEYFGSKIELVCGKERTGEAWLLDEKTDFSKIFYGEEVTIEDVEDYVLRSDCYFHNREELIERRLCRGRLSNRDVSMLFDKKLEDEKNREKMVSFFNERGVKVYIK